MRFAFTLLAFSQQLHFSACGGAALIRVIVKSLEAFCTPESSPVHHRDLTVMFLDCVGNSKAHPNMHEENMEMPWAGIEIQDLPVLRQLFYQ